MRWKRLLRNAVVAVVVLLFVGSLLGILITGPVVVRPPRVKIDARPSADRMRADVERLCSVFTPRDYTSIPNLDRAAGWIEEQMRAAGLEVETQEYELDEGTYRNVIGVRSGRDEKAGVLIIGAHYDAFDDLPGADDNASGVAVLLELIRTLPPGRPQRTEYFVAFSTEEPPFFRTDGMGSHVFASSLIERGVEVDLMIALDLVGYYSDQPDSQSFPFRPLRLLYPDRGDFVAVVGDLRAGAWIKRVKYGLLSTRAIAVHSFRAPTIVPGVDWSDHLSFRRLGLPGVLVTDTAYLRNGAYHTALDTPDRLDYARMADLVRALHGVIGGKTTTAGGA